MIQAGYRILFVCTGNICRSPTADGVLRKMLWDRGLDSQVEVDSAGLTAYHVGEKPDRRSQRTAKKRGYDLSFIRARKFERGDFQEFDLVLAMDRGHLQSMKATKPENCRARLCMFLDFASSLQESDVPDPYYGGEDGFEHVLDLVEAGSEGIIEFLKKEGLVPNGSGSG